MEVIYLLIPIALLIAVIIAVFFFWAIKSGQFDDLEGPAHRILMDKDNTPAGKKSSNDHGKENEPD